MYDADTYWVLNASADYVSDKLGVSREGIWNNAKNNYVWYAKLCGSNTKNT